MRKGSIMLRGVAAASVALTLPIVTMPATPAAAARPSLDKLEKALLRESEAPKGYSLAWKIITFSRDWLSLSDDPCKPAATKPRGAERVVASIAFSKGTDGPILSEAISVVGRKAAAATVDHFKAIVERCPVQKDEGSTTTTSRWPTPQVGDASIGLVVTIREKGAKEPSSPTAMAVVAQGDVIAIFTKDPSGADADLAEVVKAGVKRLKNL